MSVIKDILLMSIIITLFVVILLESTYKSGTKEPVVEETPKENVNQEETDVKYDISKEVQDVLETIKNKRYKHFVEQAIPYAIEIQVKYNIPVSTTLGMACYESRYGQSYLAKNHHNYFGLKALSRDYKGKRVYVKTKDYNKTVTHVQPFRKYDCMETGFEGFAYFLKKYKRYENAFNVKDGKMFVKYVQKAGYCPDYTYVTHVHKIIKRHNFDDLEKKIYNVIAQRKVRTSNELMGEQFKLFANTTK